MLPLKKEDKFDNLIGAHYIYFVGGTKLPIDEKCYKDILGLFAESKGINENKFIGLKDFDNNPIIISVNNITHII